MVMMWNLSFLNYVKYKNEEYVVLLPTEDCNGEVLIMKLTGGDVNDEEIRSSW